MSIFHVNKKTKRHSKGGVSNEDLASSSSSDPAERQKRANNTISGHSTEYQNELEVNRLKINTTHSNMDITKKELVNLRHTAELLLNEAIDENPRLTELLIIDEERDNFEDEEEPKDDFVFTMDESFII